MADGPIGLVLLSLSLLLVVVGVVCRLTHWEDAVCVRWQTMSSIHPVEPESKMIVSRSSVAVPAEWSSRTLVLPPSRCDRCCCCCCWVMKMKMKMVWCLWRLTWFVDTTIDLSFGCPCCCRRDYSCHSCPSNHMYDPECPTTSHSLRRPHHHHYHHWCIHYHTHHDYHVHHHDDHHGIVLVCSSQWCCHH